MRQAVMTEPAIIVFEDIPKPIPGKGQVLVRVIGVRAFAPLASPLSGKKRPSP